MTVPKATLKTMGETDADYAKGNEDYTKGPWNDWKTKEKTWSWGELLLLSGIHNKAACTLTFAKYKHIDVFGREEDLV